MTGPVLDMALTGLLWLIGVFWSCALFYFPWRLFAVAETRVRRAIKSRRKDVSR